MEDYNFYKMGVKISSRKRLYKENKRNNINKRTNEKGLKLCFNKTLYNPKIFINTLVGVVTFKRLENIIKKRSFKVI